MSQPSKEDVTAKKAQIAKGTGGNCKWCKSKFDTSSRLWLDKFSNWMHTGCYSYMMEEYRWKAMMRHERNGTGGVRQEQSHPDIYGGTG